MKTEILKAKRTERNISDPLVNVKTQVMVEGKISIDNLSKEEIDKKNNEFSDKKVAEIGKS